MKRKKRLEIGQWWRGYLVSDGKKKTGFVFELIYKEMYELIVSHQIIDRVRWLARKKGVSPSENCQQVWWFDEYGVCDCGSVGRFCLSRKRGPSAYYPDLEIE